MPTLRNIAVLSVVVGAIALLLPTSPAQPTPRVQGSWQVQYSGMDEKWDGQRIPTATTFTVYLYELPFAGTNQPNIVGKIPGELDLAGFFQGEKFVLYRNNDAHCGGATVNRGRELIIGELLGGGRRFQAEGTGFDSSPQCGGTWTYRLSARKLSDEVP